MDRRKRVYGRRKSDLYTEWNMKVRDTIMFLVGIGGILNELFVVNHIRPSALVFLGAMIGMPLVLKADERRGRYEKE